MTVRFLTLAEAAERVGVSQRTIRSWVHRGHLQPIPLSKDMLGRHLFSEPRVVAAERHTRQADRTGRADIRTKEPA